MKPSPSRFLRSLLPVTALFLAAPILPGWLHAQAIEGAVADAKGDATKALLKELDRQIDQLDALLDQAPNAAEKAAAKARLDALKERRSELRKTYVQARYDSLKADVKGEYNKFSAWSKKTFSNSPDAALDRRLDQAAEKASDAVTTAGAALNTAAVNTTADIAAYRLNPTEENKADVKASLATLDSEIQRLEERVDALPRGDERNATKLRVKALKERRGELTSDFRKARFDTLKADVKAEWNKLVH